MVTISQIITEAFRESNNIAIGQSPTSQEQVEGLVLFNRLIKSVFGNEAGDLLTPIAIGNNNVDPRSFYTFANVPSDGWYPPRNSRIYFNNQSAQTLNFNPSPNDGERLSIQDVSGNFVTFPLTINGNGRTIEGLNQQVLNVNGQNKEWIYRADTANWQLISPLILSSVFPFPEEFEDYFVLGLAMRLNPRNGIQMDPQSVEAYKRGKSQFRARYSQVVEARSEEGLLRTLGIPNEINLNNSRGVGTRERFNVGTIY